MAHDDLGGFDLTQEERDALAGVLVVERDRARMRMATAVATTLAPHVRRRPWHRRVPIILATEHGRAIARIDTDDSGRTALLVRLGDPRE